MAQRKILWKGLAYLSRAGYCSSCKEHGRKPQGSRQSRKRNCLRLGDQGWNPNGNLLRNANGDLRTWLLTPTWTKCCRRHTCLPSRGRGFDSLGPHGAPTGVDSDESRTRSFAGRGFDSHVLHGGRDPARDRKSRNGEGRKPGEWQSHCSSPLSRLYRSVVDRLLVTEVAGVRFPVRPQSGDNGDALIFRWTEGPRLLVTASCRGSTPLRSQ